MANSLPGRLRCLDQKPSAVQDQPTPPHPGTPHLDGLDPSCGRSLLSPSRKGSVSPAWPGGGGRSSPMLLDTAAAALDWLGVIVFAISGALVASRKQMDVVGFALLGMVTGVGGGTLRDLLLGLSPVFWVPEPAYLVVCVIVSSAVFVTAHIPQSRYRVLLWFDALGLALFAVTGAERALLVGSGPVVAVAMGVITATFGGI